MTEKQETPADEPSEATPTTEEPKTPPKNQEVVILNPPEEIGWFHALTLRIWTELFDFACTLVNVYTIQTIWNWHAPIYLGVQPVKFGAVFLLIFLLKTIVLGRVGQTLRLTKRLLYIRSGIFNDTSVRENIQFLWMNAVALGAAYLLKQYGDFL